MRDRDRYEKRVGTVVDGRWRVDSLLGWGSTSAVYAATHRNGHRAALKIIHQSLCSDPAVLERFLREAGIANAIRHRAIVPIRDDGMTEEGCAYLVVELLEGETLDAIRERANGRIDLEHFASVAEDLMSAIAAVHAAGVVHRDLKPQNVFITTSGELKLLDFGTARIRAGASVSAVGMVIGTPGFMSPEQARGARDEVDAQSDVWALGAMIFTILSGEPVHLGRDAHARLIAAASKPARKLADVAPSVDARLATVVDRALEFAKQDRWPDVQAMRLAFRHAVVAAVPSMRDLEAFADTREEEASPGTVSLSDPTIALNEASAAMDAAVVPPGVARETPSQSEIVSVTSSQPVRAVRGGIPLPSLAIGIGAMAAVVLLVVFFVTGNEPSTRAGAAAPSEPAATTSAEAPSPLAPPADSFMVISAPDLPPPAEKKKEALPPWATAPMPKWLVAAKESAATTTATTATTTTTSTETEKADAGAGGGGGKTQEPAPKGGSAPGASDVEAP